MDSSSLFIVSFFALYVIQIFSLGLMFSGLVSLFTFLFESVGY